MCKKLANNEVCKSRSELFTHAHHPICLHCSTVSMTPSSNFILFSRFPFVCAR